MKISHIISFLVSTSTVALAQSFCDATGHSGESIKVNGNKIGKIGNVDYQLWADGGNNSATFYSDGSFSCAFQTSIDYLCRTGMSFNNGKTHSQIGHITADFKVVKQSITNVGYAYVGVYGWTKNPRVEYYVVDDWLSPQRPGDWLGNQKQGDFTIDGAEYTVYKNVRSDLTQYFSLRKVGRSCGSINVSAHFQQWEKLGMTMGTIDEVKVLAEIGNSNGGVTGTVEFPYAKVYLGAPSQSQSSTQGQATTQGQSSTQGQTTTQGQNPTQGQTTTQGQNPTQGQTTTQDQNTSQNNNWGNNNGGFDIPTNPAPGQAPQWPGMGGNGGFDIPTNPAPGQAPQWPGMGGNGGFDIPSNPAPGQAPQWPGMGGNDGFDIPSNPAPGQAPQWPGMGGNGGWSMPPSPAPGQAPQWGNIGGGAPQSAVTNANGGGNCAGDWAQCGGQGFNGPTCCTKGKCLKINEYYSQCKPYL